MKTKKTDTYTHFDQFGLSPEILTTLDELGYKTPTPIQAQTIALLMDNQDVIGCAQTGTGKTAAFALPVLQRMDPENKTVQALIITPTRELAEQVYQSILDYSRKLPIRCAVLYGGVPNRPQEHQLSKNPQIVVATPGRLMDHLERRTIRLTFVKYLILDEADRMLDMGFIPDIENILTYIPRERQTLLFSATMPPAIEQLAQRITNKPTMIAVGERSSTSVNVTQSIFHVPGPSKLALLQELIKTREIDSLIIFCKTKIGVDRLTRELQRSNIDVVCLHSDIDQAARQRNLNAFKNKNIPILVATDVAARGIDIEHVSHVINYDTPTHAEDYVHRVGRTGRASATGEAFTFTSPEEIKYLKAIEKMLGQTIPVAEHGQGRKAKSTAERQPDKKREREPRGSRAEKAPPRPAERSHPREVRVTPPVAKAPASEPRVTKHHEPKSAKHTAPARQVKETPSRTPTMPILKTPPPEIAAPARRPIPPSRPIPPRRERPEQPAPTRHYMQDLEDVEYLDI